CSLTSPSKHLQIRSPGKDLLYLCLLHNYSRADRSLFYVRNDLGKSLEGEKAGTNFYTIFPNLLLILAFSGTSGFMAEKNLTLVTKFLLMAFIDCPEWALPLFLLFLFIYLITLLGNLGMIILIRVDLRLHTPMYFLLSHLLLLDICYSFATVPLMMAVLLEPRAALSYTLCAAQFFLFTFFGSIDCYLLALMANDLYMAVTCGDIYTQEVVIIVFAIFVIPACIVVISVSYLIISSEEDRVVSVFYITVIPHVEPSHLQPEEQGRIRVSGAFVLAFTGQTLNGWLGGITP
ncbi:hypothetical protein E2I00_004029, partial [Balaenoptera physalus]